MSPQSSENKILEYQVGKQVAADTNTKAFRKGKDRWKIKWGIDEKDRREAPN